MYYDPYDIYEGAGEPMYIAQMPGRMRQGPGGMRQGDIREDLDLADDISEAIIGEAHAYNFYERLAGLAPFPRQRQIILSIQRDEARHYHSFTVLLSMLGVSQPRIPAGELPATFREGVRTAIQDELRAAAFYNEIAGEASSRPVQMRFTHAGRDEQRHAALFQNMLRGI